MSMVNTHPHLTSNKGIFLVLYIFLSNATDRHLKQVSFEKRAQTRENNMIKITKSFTINKTKWQFIKHNNFSTSIITFFLIKKKKQQPQYWKPSVRRSTFSSNLKMIGHINSLISYRMTIISFTIIITCSFRFSFTSSKMGHGSDTFFPIFFSLN